uniref:Radical SAM protein n=1 Tax=Angiostrongylus cantonensis TaxID=6313 RepID=A0A0K0DIS0_ANGCA
MSDERRIYYDCARKIFPIGLGNVQNGEMKQEFKRLISECCQTCQNCSTGYYA